MGAETGSTAQGVQFEKEADAHHIAAESFGES